MGDTIGSSIAAQRAQTEDDEQTSQTPDLPQSENGFFSRVISALSPSQDGAPEDIPPPLRRVHSRMA